MLTNPLSTSTNNTPTTSANHLTFLPLIILLGLAFRLFWHYYGFNSSQFSDIDELEAYIFGQNLTYYNHARFFTYLPGPWQSLISFFAHSLFNSVKGLYFFWIVVGTMQIGFIYLFTFVWTNQRRTALIASLITALFPWPIQYTSTFWNPYFIIPLMTLAWVCLNLVLKKEKSWYILPFLLLYALMPFFHMFAAFTVPHIVYLLFKRRKQLHLFAFSLGLTLSALLYLPFVLNDAQNDWFVLSGYFSSEQPFFKPEALKVLSNLIIVMSHEVSHFVSADFKEYKIYLNQFFGFYPIAFLLMLPSFYFIIMAWRDFFKSLKSPQETTLNWCSIFWYFILTTSLFFLLATRTNHELRYTVVFWPILTVILAHYLQKEFSYLFLSSHSANPTFISFLYRFRKINFITYFLVGAYISFTLPLYLGHPGITKNNTSTSVHFYPIPSLNYWEKTEDIIRKNIGMWNGVRGGRVRPQNAEHSIPYFNNTRNLLPNSTTPTVFIDTRYYEKNIGQNNIRKQKYLLLQYLNYNGWMIADNQTPSPASTSDYTVIFLPSNQKVFPTTLNTLPEKNNHGFALWGELPHQSGSVWGKKN